MGTVCWSPALKKKKKLATPHGTWHPPSPARDGIHSLWIGPWSPGRRTARELPDSSALKCFCVADARLPACFPAPHLSTCLLSAVFRPRLILSQFLDLYCPCSDHRCSLGPEASSVWNSLLAAANCFSAFMFQPINVTSSEKLPWPFYLNNPSSLKPRCSFSHSSALFLQSTYNN